MAAWFWCLTTCALILFMPWYIGRTIRQGREQGFTRGFKEGYMARHSKKMPEQIHKLFVSACMQECGCDDCVADLAK